MKDTSVDEASTRSAFRRPAVSYWDAARPTYMENWPSDLHSLSIPSYSRKLTREEAAALGMDIVELGECFDKISISSARRKEIRTDIIQWLDDKVKILPHGGFVRLGSRSPKDAFYLDLLGVPTDFHITTGEQAYRALTACSERISDDLQMALSQDYEPYIFLRQWVDLPEWSEFRCFQRDCRLTGISQYYYRKAYPEIVAEAEGIKWAIEQFHRSCISQVAFEHSHLKDVVFDVYVTKKMRDRSKETGHADFDWHRDGAGKHYRWEVKLSEINPYFNLTDPCLFDWNKPEEFTGQLKYRAELGPRGATTVTL